MERLHEITLHGTPGYVHPDLQWICSCGVECKYPHQTLTGAKISWKAHLRKVNRDAARRVEKNLQDQTKKILATLTPREEAILRLRFGIGDNDKQSLQKIGDKLSLSRERIHQIEVKALRKLRHPHRTKRLKSFME